MTFQLNSSKWSHACHSKGKVKCISQKSTERRLCILSPIHILGAKSTHIATAAQLMDSKSVMCPSAEVTPTFMMKINHFDRQNWCLGRWNSGTFPLFRGWLSASPSTEASVSFEHPSLELLLASYLWKLKQKTPHQGHASWEMKTFNIRPRGTLLPSLLVFFIPQFLDCED